MSKLRKYLDSFLGSDQAGEPCVTDARRENVQTEHEDPAPRVCAQCGTDRASVFVVMEGGWFLCSRCWRA